MKLKLFLMLVFISVYSWSQSSIQTFNTNGAFTVPAGVTSLAVQAWGGGGAGGGANGAGLLFGRGAAGGGGGAYASAPISITPGTVLNVVVAGQTAGTSAANGSAGGNSTITGFETVVLAAGGSGGAANISDGTPVGGIGGTIVASAGTTRFAGLNGANGNSWSLLGILLSSGAGGAGANSGGVGGAAVSSIIFGNAPGNAGSAPGGAGSGAINTALGAPQTGGAGGAGKVTLSYTCPVYSILIAVPTNVCASVGSTSLVFLASTETGLPVGNYVVTYSRSSPSATGLTANMTVSTAGTGTFTAVGLTTVGTSTITITKLTSGSCSSDITTNNTGSFIISPATVAGTVNGGTTINSGSTSGLLTLSGHTGTVIKWQSSVSPFSTWTDIANTGTTYTSGPLTETTQFRAVVQNGVCATLNSQPTTVTVISAPTIQLAEFAANLCANNNGGTTENTTINYTSTTGNPITYSIVWIGIAEGYLEDVVDAPLPSSPITIVINPGSSSGNFSGILTVKNASGIISSDNNFSFNIFDIPRLESNSIISVCTSTTSQIAELRYSGSRYATSYSIDWNQDANDAFLLDQANTAFSFNSSGGTIDNIILSANVAAGTYFGTIYVYDGNCIGSKSVTAFIDSCEARSIIGVNLEPVLNENLDLSENKVSVNSLNKVLNIDSSGRNINQVYVYDVSGNLLYKKDRISDSKLMINNLRSGNQVLVVKVVLDNNKVETKKVVY